MESPELSPRDQSLVLGLCDHEEMEASEDHAAASSPRVTRSAWAIIALTLFVPVSLLAIGGFLMGTVEGDIPWPSTPQEASVYYTARDLSWTAVALAILGAVAVAVVSRRQPIGFRVTWAAFAFGATAVLGGIVFFGAYALGNGQYLSVFT